jgi:hypothetical protein
MKHFLFIVTAALAASIASASSADTPPPPAQWDPSTFSLLPRSMQKNPTLQVIIQTEFTKEGKSLKAPDPGHPAYYLALDSGLKEAGDVIAGESAPKPRDLENLMVATLKANGYLPANAAHPATLYIHMVWGSFNKLSPIDDPTGSTGPDPSNPTTPDDLEIRNLIERAALVGGTKFAVEMVAAMKAGTITQFTNRDEKTTWLMNQVYSNRYFMIATAYDYALATQNKKVVLWRTKVSTDSQGVTMDESLPSIVASAGPFIGRETDGPVRLNRPVVKDGNVLIGTATVKDYSVPAPAEPSASPPAKP